VDIQEFMVMPSSAATFNEALRAGSEVYHSLKKVLAEGGLEAGVGDEGGFVPKLKSNAQAVELLLDAIEKAGYVPGEDVVLCIDAAASEFYKKGKYILEAEGKEFDSDGMIQFYTEWVDKYPIVAIEDGLDEEDWEGWSALTGALGDRIQIVGDDIFATNPARIARGIEENAANSVLIKLNQIGTVTETLDAIRTTHLAGYSCVISHRSGETGDTYISDFAVATRGNQIKAGAPARSERVIKYNRLIKIEEELGAASVYEGTGALKSVNL
jgi:enolase